MARAVFLGLAAAIALAGCQAPPPVAEPAAVVRKGLTEAQIAVLKKEEFKPTDEGWERSLSGKLLFGTDVATLDGEGREVVQQLGRALAEVGVDRLRVDGHTDGTGSDAYNDELSLRRANTVASLLAEAGIARDNIATRGLGKRMPVASNRTEVGRSENRRVAIVVAAEK